MEATEKQKGFIKALCQRTETDEPKDLDNFSKVQASKVIDKLLEKENGNGAKAPSPVNQIKLGLAAKLVSQAWNTASKSPRTSKGTEEWLSDVQHMYTLLQRAEERTRLATGRAV